MRAKRQAVLDAIARDPRAKDDDAILIAEVWEHELAQRGLHLPQEFKVLITQLSRPESLTRARRKLHEDGVIAYSDEAMARREEGFKNERDEHSAFYVPLDR